MLLSAMHYWDAVFAFLVAMGVAFVLTPLAARLARRVDAVSTPNARGLAEHATPLLGGWPSSPGYWSPPCSGCPK